MITAIRIEHPKDGKGIFTENERKELSVYTFLPLVGERHNTNFPTLGGDTNYSHTKEDFCAYKNLEQLNEYILPDEMTEIINKGFKIYLLDLSEARVTEFQVIYKKKDILQQKDITSIFAQKKNNTI